MQKVAKLIDVKAPCQEVFDTVTNIDRRMQLSPLWGLSQLLEVAPTYPEAGSSYRVQVMTDSPFGIAGGTLNVSQSAISGLAQALFIRMGSADSSFASQSKSGTPAQPVEDHKQKTQAVIPVEQEYFIEEYQSPHKFSYILDADCKTIVTWRFQSIPFGTRINYEEIFCDDSLVYENFIPTVRHVISEWLSNIKRYSELRGGPGRMLVKRFLDRFYLKLRPDQRRVVLLMLYMQAIGLATFAIAVIGWGIVSLFF